MVGDWSWVSHRTILCARLRQLQLYSSMQGACLLRVSILRSLQSWSVRISPSLYNNFYILLLPYCGRIVKHTRQMENFSGCGGCGGCSVNENIFPWIISNSTLIDNKYFSWIWCQSHLWQSPLTALVLPMAGAAQPKHFIVKIRNYNSNYNYS